MSLHNEASEPLGGSMYSLARVRHEFVDVEMFGMDPGNPVATDLMTFCSGVLALIALQPEACTLVVSGDFVESVRQRLPAGEYRDNYSLLRGSGMVGGKTLQVGSEVHVIMPAALFVTDDATYEDPDTPGQRVTFAAAFGLGPAQARETLARRTVVHEAQHVAMLQAGEDRDPSADQPWVRRNYLAVASQVICEYRAEVGVPAELREGDDENSALSGLRALREDFRRIAAVEYQAHLDIARLEYGIMQECQTGWKVLAYFAAARRIAGVTAGASVSGLLASSEEWSMMAAPHWRWFEALLADLPPGAARIDAETLDQVTTELADGLPRWLGTWGFVWQDVGDHREFRISSWDLMV